MTERKAQTAWLSLQFGVADGLAVEDQDTQLFATRQEAEEAQTAWLRRLQTEDPTAHWQLRRDGDFFLFFAFGQEEAAIGVQIREIALP